MLIRGLYRCVVWLHPPSFRMQFEEEMLWIFDQAAGHWSSTALLADAGLSLARQWLKGSALWKGVGAITGGIVSLVIGYGSFIPWERVWHTLRWAF